MNRPWLDLLKSFLAKLTKTPLHSTQFEQDGELNQGIEQCIDRLDEDLVALK